MKRVGWIVRIGVLFAPGVATAQDISSEVRGLHKVLNELYGEMIPLCSQLIGVGRGVAGFAALVVHRCESLAAFGKCRAYRFLPAVPPFCYRHCASCSFPTCSG